MSHARGWLPRWDALERERLDEIKRLADLDADAMSEAEVSAAITALSQDENYGKCKVVAASYASRLETCNA